MLLKSNEVDKLWHLEQPVLSYIESGGILVMGGWLPILLILPLAFAKFAPWAVKSSIVISALYVIYTVLTYVVLRWHFRSASRAAWVKRFATLMVLGWRCLLGCFFSLVTLSTAILSARYVFPRQTILVWAMVLWSLVEAVLTLLYAPYLIRIRVVRSPGESYTPGEMRWALGIQSGIIGLGFLLSTILAKSSVGLTAAVWMAFLGAVVVMPFSLVLLYQFIAMAWDWAFVSHQKSQTR